MATLLQVDQKRLARILAKRLDALKSLKKQLALWVSGIPISRGKAIKSA